MYSSLILLFFASHILQFASAALLIGCCCCCCLHFPTNILCQKYSVASASLRLAEGIRCGEL